MHNSARLRLILLAAGGLLAQFAPTPVPVQEPELDLSPRFLQSIHSCARCHNPSSDAEALHAIDGSDASPVGTFNGTVMQSAFIDPYYRAQLAHEASFLPAEQASELESDCLRCHAPLVAFERQLAQQPPANLAQTLLDGRASEGVSCTACHRIGPDGLGDEATFDGHPPLSLDARLFGPYPEPFTGPMLNMTGYEVTYGPHMVGSSLCGTCHTLRTHPSSGADPFLEQSPYLEWRNSDFSYEQGATEKSRSCQACHMTDVGSMKIAHAPSGFDFAFLEDRPEVRTHGIVGGNAMLLDLLAANGEELGALASTADYERLAVKTRQQLGGQTVSLEVEAGESSPDTIEFNVVVGNRAGHRLPTGYPSRRMWLEVQVEGPNGVWFASGVPDEEGRILPKAEAFSMPHLNQITEAQQVQIWERVAVNSAGAPTTRVATMARSLKDNRLLPLGWSADGPHAERTGPVGVGDDPDFLGGEDRVAFSLTLPESQAGKQTVEVRVLFQTMPPAWTDPFAEGKSEAERRFTRMLAEAPTRYEVLAEGRVRIGG
ncbi:MAG TPA: hypothetical protein EYQ74_01530 [Planctomycetes bacterium]|nr:hypothetical protein [Planctomycetota bacterium]HIK61834.1 hypothetical protein [Planctomycetota bacterium]